MLSPLTEIKTVDGWVIRRPFTRPPFYNVTATTVLLRAIRGHVEIMVCACSYCHKFNCSFFSSCDFLHFKPRCSRSKACRSASVFSLSKRVILKHVSLLSLSSPVLRIRNITKIKDLVSSFDVDLIGLSLKGF